MREANILETDIDVPQIVQSFYVKDDRQIKNTAENMDKSSGASVKHVVYLIDYFFLFIITIIYKNYY
uniref:Uncharacterized protein n=1 Tax=Arion vulgaris TaxID=1028688 RepID=A0A0B7AW53_9EUPU